MKMYSIIHENKRQVHFKMYTKAKTCDVTITGIFISILYSLLIQAYSGYTAMPTALFNADTSLYVHNK